MNRATAIKLQKELEANLQGLATLHNLTISKVTGRYGTNNVSYRVEFAEQNEDGIVLSKEATRLNRDYRFYGFSESPLGKTFKVNGTEYTLTGMSQGRKYPFLATRNSDGKRFKFGEFAVTSAFKVR